LPNRREGFRAANSAVDWLAIDISFLSTLMLALVAGIQPRRVCAVKGSLNLVEMVAAPKRAAH
jgi:hypothetical protein